MPRTLKQFRLWLGALVIFLTGVASAARAAGTNAVIPFKELDEMFQPISAVDPARLEVHVFVSSTNKAVRPSDIRLAIHSAGRGLIPVELNTNGRVIRFPDDRDLRRENPPVIANQPAGSMRFTIAIQLPPTDELTFRYSRLAGGVAEMNKSIKAQAGMVMSLFAPKVEGVIFLFSKTNTDQAKVEIASAAGAKEYTADRNGQIKLKLEKSLVAENPEVKLSEKPQHIVPDLSDF